MSKAPTDIRSLARSHTESAINVLCRIMGSPKAPAAARVTAAQALLDRGWGKPTQILAGYPENPIKLDATSLRPQITREDWLARHGANEKPNGSEAGGGCHIP
jgi:hypothetical protein